MAVTPAAPGGRYQVEGLGKAQRAIAQLSARAPEMGGRAIRAGGAQLGEAIEKRAPELSGDMRGTIPRSIRMRRISEQTVDVGTTHGLAPLFEYGGEITPTRAEYLHFVGDYGEIFTRRVVMPAKPFFRPAIDESRNDASNAVARSARKSIARITRTT